MPSYRPVVARRSWRQFFAASTLSRLPVTMGVFGMVLAGHALGSFSLGARLAAVYTITGALTAVSRGRRLDRGDRRTGLRRDGAVVVAVAIAMAVCVQAKGPAVVAAGLAVALGLAMAAIPGGYRALVASVVPEEDRDAAYALDAVCVEMCFVAGPALAGAVAWFGGPTGVFLLMAACALAGTVAAGRLPASEDDNPGELTGPPPYRVPIMLAVLAGALCLGMGVGVLDATFPALAVALGTRAAVGGGFVTLMALGSGTSGLLLGGRIHRGDVGRRAALILGVFGLVVLPMAASPNVLVVVPLAILAGAPFALLTISASALIQREIDPSRAGEAFSLLNAGLLAGDSLGSAMASAALGPGGARNTMLLAAVGPCLGGLALLVVITARRRLALAA
jgi:MFS family permease